MAPPLRDLLDKFTDGLQKAVGVETAEQRQDRETREVQQAVASLLYETARVDRDVKAQDLRVAEQSLRELFALSPEQARSLLGRVAQPDKRPTSYHPLTKIINNHFSAEEKRRLVEYMWRVAHADHEVDMYEDHLVRKISELLYVSHREFISAKHRARDDAD
jgi:uncharacterized tellurite resistance protein B-like protein